MVTPLQEWMNQHGAKPYTSRVGPGFDGPIKAVHLNYTTCAVFSMLEWPEGDEIPARVVRPRLIQSLAKLRALIDRELEELNSMEA